MYNRTLKPITTRKTKQQTNIQNTKYFIVPQYFLLFPSIVKSQRWKKLPLFFDSFDQNQTNKKVKNSLIVYAIEDLLVCLFVLLCGPLYYYCYISPRLSLRLHPKLFSAWVWEQEFQILRLWSEVWDPGFEEYGIYSNFSWRSIIYTHKHGH